MRGDGKMKTRMNTLLILGLVALCGAARADSVDTALEALKSWSYGQDFTACQTILDAVVDAQRDPAARAALAARLAAALPASPYDGQKFLFEQLYIVGTENETEALAPFLTDERLSPLARYALERIPGEKVDRALAAAAGKAQGAALAGILDSLASRDNPAHTALIAAHLADRDPVAARAAVDALGKLGGPAAVAALENALKRPPRRLRPALVDALLACADKAARTGNTASAVEIHTRLLTQMEDSPVRVAAFCGLVRHGGTTGLSRLITALSGADLILRAPALALLREVPGDDITGAGVSALETAEPSMLPLLVAALADRGDAAAYPALTPLLDHADPAARNAAILAVGALGDASAAAPLARRLAAAEGDEERALQDALAALKGAEVDAVLGGMLPGAEPGTAVKLMQSLTRRNAAGCAPVLFEMAVREDPAPRAEAFRALGALVPADALPALVDSLSGAGDDTRPDAERAVVAALRRLGPDAGAAKLLTARHAATRNPAAKAALLRVMGETGDPALLDTLRKAARAMRKELRLAAVEALSNWPTAEPLGELRRAARRGRPEAVREAAFAGFLRMLKLAADLPPEELLALHREALSLAKTPDQTRRALSSAGELKDPGALDLLAPFAAGEFKAEAAAAAEKVRARLEKE